MKEENRGKLQVLKGGMLVTVCWLMMASNSIANGGEEMEESQYEETMVQGEMKCDSINGCLDDMEYALFVETNIGYGVTLNYYRYGIYGNFTKTTKDGEEIYFDLCEKFSNKEIVMSEHEQWADNQNSHIQNLSSDLQWIVMREYPKTSLELLYKDVVFHNGKIVGEGQGSLGEESLLFDYKKNSVGGYELLDSEIFTIRKEKVNEIWGYDYVALVNNVTDIDEKGKLLAVAEPDNQTICIYYLENQELLHRITVDELDADWPLEVSQIVGEKDNGWVVFSNGDITYKMTYPNGNINRIGNYMYGTVYSPDEKYRAYCTGNIELYDLGLSISDGKYEKYSRLYDEWEKVPVGWYVEEVNTGKKMYIPIDTWEQDNRPLYGGRCVWIEKDKLETCLE